MNETVFIPVDSSTTRRDLADALALVSRKQTVLLDAEPWLWEERRASFLATLTKSQRSFALRFMAHHLPTPQALTHLHQAGCERFHLILFGGSRLLADKQAGGEVFNQAREGLRRMRELSLPLTLELTVTAINHGDLEHLVEQLWAMDLLISPLLFHDDTGLFHKDIQKAHAYRTQLLEDTLPVPEHLYAEDTGERFSIQPDACPLRSGAFPRDDFAGHLLLKEEEETFRLLSLGTTDPMLLTRTKLAREHVARLYDGEVHKLRMVEACRTCPQLSRCATMFEEDPNCPAQTVEDLQTGLREETKHTTLQTLKTLKPGSSITLQGSAPWILVSESDAPADFLPAPSEAVPFARLAHALGLEITAYQLNYGHLNRPWTMTLQAPATPKRDQRERLAIAQLTSACVARCVMCSIPQYFRGAGIPTGPSLRLLEELRLCGFSVVDLFGGEITLRHDLDSLIREAKHCGLSVMLISTAWLLDEPRIEALEQAGVDRLTVSLDSAAAPMHDRIKGKPGLWKRTVQAIRTILERGRLALEINSVILHDNWRELPDLLAFSHALGIRSHRFFYAVNTLKQFSPPRWMDATEAGVFFETVKPALDAFGKQQEMDIDFMPDLQPPEDPDARRRFLDAMGQAIYQQEGRCFVPAEEVFITPNGEVHVCLNFIGKEKPLGTLGESHSLLDILQSDPAQEATKQAGFLPTCRHCFAKRNRQ